MAQPFVDPCGRGVINAEACPREFGRELPSRQRRIILIACVIASSMAFIDGSVLTVALPRLLAALGTDLAPVSPPTRYAACREPVSRVMPLP
jgi:predicted dienelactone hydrolase